MVLAKVTCIMKHKTYYFKHKINFTCVPKIIISHDITLFKLL